MTQDSGKKGIESSLADSEPTPETYGKSAEKIKEEIFLAKRVLFVAYTRVYLAESLSKTDMKIMEALLMDEDIKALLKSAMEIKSQ